MPDLDLDEQLGGLASHAETSGRFADAAALRARGDRMRRDHRRGVVAAGALSVALVASALTGTLLRHSARDGAHPAPPASHPAATDPAGPSVPVEARSDRILPGAWMAPGELPHAPGETWTVGSAPAVAGSPGPSGLVVTFPCESKQLSAAWAGLPSQLSVLGSTDPNRSARQMTLFHPDLQRAGNTLEDLVYGLNKCTSPVKDGSAGLVTDRKSYATSGWAFLPKRSSGDPHPVQLYFARSGTTVTVLRILGGPVPRTAEEYRKVRDTLVERTRVYAEQGTKIYDGSQIDTRAFMKPDELAHYGTEKWTLQSGPRVDFANRPRAESASLLPCGAKELRLAIGRQVQIYDTADRASDAAEARSQFQYVLFTSGHDEAATLYRTFADALSKCGRQALGPSVAAVKRTAVGKSGSAWSYATSSPGDYNFRDVHVFIAPAGSTVSILILQTLEAGESYATGQDPAVLKALEAHACVYDDDGC